MIPPITRFFREIFKIKDFFHYSSIFSTIGDELHNAFPTALAPPTITPDRLEVDCIVVVINLSLIGTLLHADLARVFCPACPAELNKLPVAPKPPLIKAALPIPHANPFP